MNQNSKFQKAIATFNRENAADPTVITYQGKEYPQEKIYAKWLSDWIKQLEPEPSEPLLLAAHCQHICRWEIPRNSFPMDRTGYLKWRETLKKFHAEKAAEILSESGYDGETIQRVRSINMKKNVKNDPDCQLMEDALCLVFLEHQFDALIEKTEDAKMISIIQKTWKKMSEKAHTFALEIAYSTRAGKLVEQALGVTK